MNSLRNTFLVLFLTLAATVSAGEIGYVESFALAPDRTVPLAQLIPGTEDYYYYHCLHYQNTEQFDKVEQMLAAWIKRHKETPRVREIQNRQALLTYEQSPEKSLALLRDRLGLLFNHQRETLGQKPNLPSRLDPKLISRDALIQAAFARHSNLQGFENAALDWLVATDLNAERRRHLLERLQRPDHPNLPKLVVDDLNTKNSRGFGSFAIHNLLLLDQLEACLELKPELLNQTKFVNAYLTKLHPNPDVDWQYDTAERQAYLDRLWAFAQRLAPVHNSLKAHVLYHRLELDRSQGKYDKDRFMTYLTLPRQVGYMNPDFMRLETNRQYPANLRADFGAQTMLPPVYDDEPLVRSYLHHFFQDEASYKEYEPYVQDLYLKRHFAEAKIVSGLGDGEQWYSMLSPADYQQLKDRIDIEFAFTNRQRFLAEDPVSLDLFVKNVETLIVKIYEINTTNFYRENLREVNTDINLDGLVPNWEQTYKYGEPPLQRVRRHFEFPELVQPGVYVIDFIGNGTSSRAVVRKGRLRHAVRTTTAGQVFTVMDEKNRPLPKATIWFSGREYTPDDQGEIVVPFTNRPTRQAMVIRNGEFASLGYFQHLSEQYTFGAGIYVDRQQLLRRKKATVVIRPGLYLNASPVTLSVLEDVRLVITSTDHDGVTTTKEVEDFELFEDREATYEFQTPQRLSSIQFSLEAKIQNLSQNKKIDVSASRTFKLNQIDLTEKVEDLHLAKIGENYVVELLGRSGEPKADRAVRLSLKHGDFIEPVKVSLKTDADGRVYLGTLDGIRSVTATGPEDTSETWALVKDQHTQYSALHGVAGQTLTVAYMGAGDRPKRDELSLLEMRGDTFVADRFDALKAKDGLLQIGPLERGDYDLWLKRESARIRIRIADGRQRGDRVLGENRQLEVRGQAPLQISSVTTGDREVTIRLKNASKYSRVHLFATRYQPAFAPNASLSNVRDANPAWTQLAKLESLYMAGRNIGDEYRYIIDRKYAQKYPGNMLERPSLLLNPWAVRSTETGKQEAAEGEDYEMADEAPADAYGGAGAGGGIAGDQTGFANLDFLAEASTVLLNLTADEKGVISVPVEALGPNQHLHIVAIDPRNTVYRSLALDSDQCPTDDLRLAVGLDPAKHYSQQKQISVVQQGEVFELADITSSKFEMYDTLAKAYGLYVTLSGDADLIEFGFVTGWPKLTIEEKQEKYSKYACHELNLFLAKKDPKFFRDVVLPYLKNKKDKQFVDRWLLGEDAKDALQPWNHAQLNIAERIFLGQRLPADRPFMSRHVHELYSLIPPDIERFNFLFTTAVKGSSLDTDDSLGWAKAKTEQLSRQSESLRSMSRTSRRAVTATPRPPAAAPAMDAPAPSAEPEAAATRMALELREKQTEKKRAQNRLSNSTKDGKMDAYFDVDADRRKQVRQYFQQLDKTQEWAENNYYHLPIEQQKAELISVNGFWRDLAVENPTGDQAFRSERFAEACRNFHEIMLALAVLDLPFEAGEHKSEFEGARMKLTAGSPMVVFHEEIKETEDVAEDTPILVSQNFFRHGDRYQYVDNQQLDKFVKDEFLVHTVYGCQIVVTNPTSAPQKLDILLQVPLGSIPVMNGQYTRSVQMDLPSYNTQTVEYYFYFPAPGLYPHYPVHVSKNAKLLAAAEPVELNVVEQLTQIDRTSWDYVSQYGTDEEVIDYLKQNNLQRTKLDRIAFRVQNKDFFERVLPLLEQRHAYDQTLWSYGVKHNQPAAIRQFLQHADGFLRQCGQYIDSPLLTIDPVARRAYQHLDYRPLVNARAHQLGRQRQILNDRLSGQYRQLMTILSYRRQLDDVDRMAVIYYLLLQDRVTEALEQFAQVNPDRLETRLQYDYFTAYLDFYKQAPDHARQIVDRYKDYPVDRWREAFAAVAGQLDEIEGGAAAVVDDENRDQVQDQLASSEASFDFQVEAKQITINYQNLKQVQVNYYLMDIELLFSRNPFVQQYSGQFSNIRPNLTQTVDLPDGATHRFQLPEQLHSSNVLVEITGDGQTHSQAYYSNSLAVQVIGGYGQVRVAHAQTNKPLAAVYVKAYARMKDGSVKFYKDGYTDLRGRFDYTSLSTNELDFVQKFSLLILSDEYGAVVREADPPKR